MIGIVKFFNEAKGFGFIRFSSTSSDRLDQEIFFPTASLRSFVEPGDRVEFDIELSEVNENQIAANIVPAPAERHTGVVAATTGKNPGYSFLSVDGRYGDDQRLFFAHDDCVPDGIGRRLWPENTLVSFEIAIVGGRERAVNVRNESQEQFDLTTYREFGRVTHWEPDRGFGHITRPNRETLTFLSKNVVSEGVDEICRGKWLRYGLFVQLFVLDRTTEQFRHKTGAIDIFICAEEGRPLPTTTAAELNVEPGSFEELFLSAPEITPEPPPVVQRKPNELFTPAEIKLPLREIIRRRKHAA